jgi:hypothetical protein
MIRRLRKAADKILEHVLGAADNARLQERGADADRPPHFDLLTVCLSAK